MNKKEQLVFLKSELEKFFKNISYNEWAGINVNGVTTHVNRDCGQEEIHLGSMQFERLFEAFQKCT